MSTTENITTMKLKIRIGSFRIGADPVIKPCEISQRLVLGSICNNSEIVKSQNTATPSSDTSNNKLSLKGSKKRGLSEASDGENKKRRKMDRSVTQQCAIILKKLMSHPAGWVFNQPVDPVKLQIPDYFNIISDPMDLGTIKRKLNNGEYSSVDGFTSHVRLTFSNAMIYNPPDDNVYRMAKELNDLFNLQWAALEAKWSGGRKIVKQRQNIVKKIDNSCESGIDNSTSYVRSEPKRLISDVEKQDLKKQLLELLRGKVPSHLQGFLKKSGFDFQRIEKIEKVVDALGNEDLMELKKIIRSHRVVRTAKASLPKEPDHVGQQSPVKIINKVIDNAIQSASGSTNIIQPTNSATSEYGLGRNMKCEINKKIEITHASKDISSDRSWDHLDVAIRNCDTKLHSDPPSSKLELESKGDEIALHEARISSCPSVSTTDTATTSAEGCGPLVDVQLSPQKALRAALLKSRFAETILKAKQKALLNHGDKADPVKIQQEKERLERRQHEERVKIEAQLRASKEAVRMREEFERKLKREQEREAARLALQKMVKTVEIYNDPKILKDLELLSGCSLSDQYYSCSSCESSPEVASVKKGHFSRALEQLGLFMKDNYNIDYMEDEDEIRVLPSRKKNGDEEEGEIFP